MNPFCVVALVLNWIVVGVGCWLGWQLLRQNGRILLRLDELEKRFDELEFVAPEVSDEAPTARSADFSPLPGEPADEMRTELRAPVHEQDDRANRFSNRSLARSRIKRDGLKAGTSAPGFRLPRLDGGELALEELRGCRVLLIFSDPHCGPCNALAPELEKFHRDNCHGSVANRGTTGTPLTPCLSPEKDRVSEGRVRERLPITVLMISRGEPRENRAKVKEYKLTFPVLLQQRWEISRRYGMFATPVAYLIGGDGVIANSVAVGVERILKLMAKEADQTHNLKVASLVNLLDAS